MTMQRLISCQKTFAECLGKWQTFIRVFGFYLFFDQRRLERIVNCMLKIIPSANCFKRAGRGGQGEGRRNSFVLTKEQEEVLKEILQNRDVLAALPTGQMHVMTELRTALIVCP